MAITKAMVTIAHCDFCPKTLPHVSNDSSPWDFFERKHWTVIVISDEHTAVACSNQHCINELKKIREGQPA